MLSFIKKYPATLFTAAIIAVLSLMRIPELPPDIEVPLADKWTHMLMYGALCFILWAEYWRCHSSDNRANRLGERVPHFAAFTALAIAAPIAWGGAMELMQAYATTYRSGDWLDLVADIIGVLVATPVGIAFGRFIGVGK